MAKIINNLSDDSNVIKRVGTLGSAIEKVAVYNYDSIILDIGLPEGD